MFKQIKSALFWYYLYKFRKRFTVVVFLILLSIFANSIYVDVIQYLQLKNKLDYLELAFTLKWSTILASLTISAYLILTLFKKEEEQKAEQKQENKREKKKIESNENKKVKKSKFTSREEKFLNKETLNTQVDKLVNR